MVTPVVDILLMISTTKSRHTSHTTRPSQSSSMQRRLKTTITKEQHPRGTTLRKLMRRNLRSNIKSSILETANPQRKVRRLRPVMELSRD